MPGVSGNFATSHADLPVAPGAGDAGWPKLPQVFGRSPRMPIRTDMYTVIGTYSDGSKCKPLSYPTLAEALKKLQDLIEADECEIAWGGGETEERGIRMFIQYTVVPHQVVEVAKPTPQHDREGDGPSLRLVR
jgi:hypothetical protein